MIDIDKLEQIQHDIINSDDDKKEVIELFNRQLSLLDKVTDEFDICYELAKNIDDALSLIQKIWIKTDRKHNVAPIIRSTTNIKKLVKFKREHIQKALDELNSSKSLDELKNISSDIISMQLEPTINIILSDINHEHAEHISMQMDHLTNLILADIDPLHADRLAVDHNLYPICSTNMFSNVIQIFFNAVDTQRKIDTMNKLISDESRTNEINVLYPTFVDDFKQTTKELLDRLEDSIDLFNEYKGLSKSIYKIYKKYEILK